jgi:hypothetical protein
MAIEAKEASKKAHEIVVDFAKQITTISAAILSFFVSLVASKTIDFALTSKYLIFFAFCSLFLSVVFAFWVILGVAGSLDAVAHPARTANSKEASENPSVYRSNIRIPLTLTIFCFLFGILFVALSIFWN